MTLSASFTLGNMPGPQSVAINVLTSPAGNGPKLITFDWDLVTPLHAVPDRCQLGRLDLERELLLDSSCGIGESRFAESARFELKATAV